MLEFSSFQLKTSTIMLFNICKTCFFKFLLDQSYHLDQKTEQLELQPKIRYVLEEDSDHFLREKF